MPGHEFFTSEVVASYLTLTFLEIVLAGDNLVLIAILAGRLPERQRPQARRFGLIAAVFTRLGLLFSLFWLAHLERQMAIPLPGGATALVSPRQIVLGIGGLFLIWKSFAEISSIFAARERTLRPGSVRAWGDSFAGVIVQIAIFDIVFSLDSVIAAIGIARRVEVMAAAIVTAAFFMLFLVNPISNFIDRHKIVRLIALNFLVLIGALLVIEALNLAVPHTYVYFALAAAVVIQILFLWVQSLPGAARVTVGLLVILASLAAVVGATLYWNNDAAARDRALATLNALLEGGGALVTGTIDWLKSLVS